MHAADAVLPAATAAGAGRRARHWGGVAAAVHTSFSQQHANFSRLSRSHLQAAQHLQQPGQLSLALPAAAACRQCRSIEKACMSIRTPPNSPAPAGGAAPPAARAAGAARPAAAAWAASRPRCGPAPPAAAAGRACPSAAPRAAPSAAHLHRRKIGSSGFTVGRSGLLQSAPALPAASEALASPEHRCSWQRS